MGETLFFLALFDLPFPLFPRSIFKKGVSSFPCDPGHLLQAIFCGDRGSSRDPLRPSLRATPPKFVSFRGSLIVGRRAYFDSARRPLMPSPHLSCSFSFAAGSWTGSGDVFLFPSTLDSGRCIPGGCSDAVSSSPAAPRRDCNLPSLACLLQIRTFPFFRFLTSDNRVFSPQDGGLFPFSALQGC